MPTTIENGELFLFTELLGAVLQVELFAEKATGGTPQETIPLRMNSYASVT
jgi:hypothetical protein